MDNRIAVMDLGTNIFHLLIADATGAGFEVICHEEIAVKLGEGGINKGYILPAAFERGIDAMRYFQQLIVKNKAERVRAIATSALRNAANGREFAQAVREQAGIEVEIISGEQEAGFIYQGIRASGCLSDQNSLIADIGGGSVEFIICNRNEVFWKQSFEVGAARLLDKFHQTDPMPAAAVDALHQYLQDTLKPLFTAIENWPVQNLVGSSGVFESYAVLIERSRQHPFSLEQTRYYSFEITALRALIDAIILSSHQQRMDMKEIIPVRIDMIVAASVLVRLLVQQFAMQDVLMCTYSLKEGVLAEMAAR